MSTRSAGKRLATVTALVATGWALVLGSAGAASAAAPAKSVNCVVSHAHHNKHVRHHGKRHGHHVRKHIVVLRHHHHR